MILESRVFSPPQIISHSIQPVYCFPKPLLCASDLCDDLLSTNFCRNPTLWTLFGFLFCLKRLFLFKHIQYRGMNPSNIIGLAAFPLRHHLIEHDW